MDHMKSIEDSFVTITVIKAVYKAKAKAFWEVVSVLCGDVIRSQKIIRKFEVRDELVDIVLGVLDSLHLIKKDDKKTKAKGGSDPDKGVWKWENWHGLFCTMLLLTGFLRGEVR
jgi:hypothetical protein